MVVLINNACFFGVGHAELRMVDFAGSFFDMTSGGKQTKELISRCTALMQLPIPTIRQFGVALRNPS
jgi:hypothetical protein